MGAGVFSLTSETWPGSGGRGAALASGNDHTPDTTNGPTALTSGHDSQVSRARSAGRGGGMRTEGPLEPETGIEPVTPTLPRLCSTPELLGPDSLAARALPVSAPGKGAGKRRKACSRGGGQWRIRTSEGVCQLIYSQSRLATSVTARAFRLLH